MTTIPSAIPTAAVLDDDELRTTMDLTMATNTQLLATLLTLAFLGRIYAYMKGHLDKSRGDIPLHSAGLVLPSTMAETVIGRVIAC